MSRALTSTAFRALTHQATTRTALITSLRTTFILTNRLGHGLQPTNHHGQLLGHVRRYNTPSQWSEHDEASSLHAYIKDRIRAQLQGARAQYLEDLKVKVKVDFQPVHRALEELKQQSNADTHQVRENLQKIEDKTSEILSTLAAISEDLNTRIIPEITKLHAKNDHAARSAEPKDSDYQPSGFEITLRLTMIGVFLVLIIGTCFMMYNVVADIWEKRSGMKREKKEKKAKESQEKMARETKEKIEMEMKRMEETRAKQSL